MAEHDGCVGCKYEHLPEESSHCQGCTQNAVDKYTRMTMGDRIRNMTDKELADWLFYFYDGDDYASVHELYNCLRSEVGQN